MLESKTTEGIEFPVHANPNQLISDMLFNSLRFDKEFAAGYEFKIITSLPGYPQSNGKVENTIIDSHDNHEES